LLIDKYAPLKLHTSFSCGSIKLNVDAANNTAAFAVLARGDDGEVLKAWTKLVQLDDPLVAEAAAALWALELVSSEKFQNILVEGDCKKNFNVELMAVDLGRLIP
jgi:hypothetical protein